MSEWEDIQKKHLQEWKEFEKSKRQAWQKMNDKHVEIGHVFKNDPNRIPEETATLIKTEKEKFAKDWGKEGYHRLRLMFRQQRDTERLIRKQERERRVFELADQVQQIQNKRKGRGR